MRRPVTSLDPWQAEQDELDRQFEHAPVNERPIFPPSPGRPLSRAGIEEHCAADPLDDNTGSAAVVLAVKE